MSNKYIAFGIKLTTASKYVQHYSLRYVNIHSSYDVVDCKTTPPETYLYKKQITLLAINTLVQSYNK